MPSDVKVLLALRRNALKPKNRDIGKKTKTVNLKYLPFKLRGCTSVRNSLSLRLISELWYMVTHKQSCEYIPKYAKMFKPRLLLTFFFIDKT